MIGVGVCYSLRVYVSAQQSSTSSTMLRPCRAPSCNVLRKPKKINARVVSPKQAVADAVTHSYPKCIYVWRPSDHVYLFFGRFPKPENPPEKSIPPSNLK
ncbi:unnamed protein product [Laminaria digitata]